MKQTRGNTRPGLALRLALCLAALFCLAPAALAQAGPAAAAEPGRGSDGIALAPARFELEMQPGSETTVVVNLDYHSAKAEAQPSRILATLNDWAISQTGELEFFRAGTRPRSACPWMIYSPAEVLVRPGSTHSIRVTISVPKEATPGDHLAALVVEQRPDTIKLNQNARQMLLRFRMAALFYIKVPGLTRSGSLENLKAAAGPDGVVVTATLKNAGNSVVRPLASVTITDAAGRVAAELPEAESLPVLAGSELSRPVRVPKHLAPGLYTVKYRVDFQGYGKTTEGVTELLVKGAGPEPAVATAGAPRP
ncbi:MAG TPA: hypothetical protein VG148_08160 [Pyrinomonadaceae bacterium]|nr:hypothetical protein [Pyrinomonadaceae bacterium]